MFRKRFNTALVSISAFARRTPCLQDPPLALTNRGRSVRKLRPDADAGCLVTLPRLLLNEEVRGSVGIASGWAGAFGPFSRWELLGMNKSEMADEALFLLLHNEMVSGLYRAAEQGDGVSASFQPDAFRVLGKRGGTLRDSGWRVAAPTPPPPPPLPEGQAGLPISRQLFRLRKRCAPLGVVRAALSGVSSRYQWLNR